MDIDISLKFFSYKKKIFIEKKWVQFAIVVITIFATAIVSYWGSTKILMLIPLVFGGIAFVLVLLQKVNIGFILILLSGMFVPFAGPGGVNATALIAAMLIVLWLLDMFVIKRDFHFIKSKPLLPVVIFLVCSVISFAMGQIPWFIFANQAPLDAQIGGFAIFVLSLGIMIATAHLIQDIKWLEIIVWFFIGFGAIYVFGRIFQLPVDRVYQSGFVAGSMFWTWLIALAFGQLVYNHRLKKSLKGFLLILVLATFYVAIVQSYDWKSGWLPPLVVVAVLLGLRYPRLVLLAIPIALIVAGTLISALILSDEYSWGTRIDAWRIVLEISRANPLFGLGFSNYYWYTPLFPIRGWSISFNSHSQYVDLIAQVGLLGLVSFLWIFFEVGKLGWRLKNHLPDGFSRSYAYSVLAGTIATLVAAFLVDWVLPFVYNIGFNGFRASILPWIFFGGLISIEQIYKGKETNK
jgi:O-antigen ligase